MTSNRCFLSQSVGPRLALGALVLWVGCSDPATEVRRPDEPERAEQAAGQESSGGQQSAAVEIHRAASDSAWRVTDRLARDVRFTEPPERVVSLLPSLTELMYAVGAGSHMVGATNSCDYPAEAAELPRVGEGTLQSLSRETLVGLQPDLVLCKWDHHGPLIDDLERLGISCLALGPENLKELYAEAVLLGEVTGHPQEAERFVDQMKRRIASLKASVPRLPSDHRPKVFYQVWGDPLMTAGPRSFIGELLKIAGTQNIIHDTDQRYPKVSAEVVASRNPDIILAPSSHASAVTIEEILNRPGWSEVTAVRRGRVHVIDGSQVSRCGPRLVDALEEIIEVVHGGSRQSGAGPAQASSGVASASRAAR